jgi:biopolymer transport protein ExbD
MPPFVDIVLVILIVFLLTATVGAPSVSGSGQGG